MVVCMKKQGGLFLSNCLEIKRVASIYYGKLGDRQKVICTDFHDKNTRFALSSSQNLFLGDHLASVFNILDIK